MAQPSLHPSIDSGIKQGASGFGGGTLYCKCPSDKVAVEISGDVAHNHACGCSKCWKPEGALFSVVGVVPTDKLRVTAHQEKLAPVDPSAAIVRYACKQCGTHMYGRIEKDHPFKGLDFVHTELSDKPGWQAPQFAAFVSSIIEQGFEPSGMDSVRGKLHSAGLETYDCLAPGLMDAIASYGAKKAGTAYKEGAPATSASSAAPKPSAASSSRPTPPTQENKGGIAGFFAKLFGG